jgi:hypothetical protein
MTRPLSGIQRGVKVFPHDLLDGGGTGPMVKKDGNYWFVDGDASGEGGGRSWQDPKSTIAQAISAASAGDVIYIAPLEISAGDTDPSSYEENLTIPPAKSSLSLIGVSRGRTQGGLPQLKDGATTTQEILRIRSSGCLVKNLGFNGAGNTAGAILLDESASGYTAFGTSILGCHFKNAKGTTSTDSRTGGAIMWTANGGAWQTLIAGNNFYKCVADVVLKGTSSSRPQDVVIENNVFSGPAASVDCNLYLGGGSGINGVTIQNNVFPVLAVPALGSGSVLRYIDATGCTGILSNNNFNLVAQATDLTFGAAGTAAKIPVTMRMVNNFGESDTEGDTGIVYRT